MDEYKLKVVGVHYAANHDERGAATDMEAMEERTVEMLRWLDAERPRVVLVAENETGAKNAAGLLAEHGFSARLVADSVDMPAEGEILVQW